MCVCRSRNLRLASTGFACSSRMARSATLARWALSSGRRLTAGLLLAAGTTIVATAQQPQRPPVFRTNTELVEIDVVVIDKDGKRVHGLTKDDFVLKDRKKPQAIE